MEKKQTASTILMVRPGYFAYNEETAASNAFQTKQGAEKKGEIREEAKEEFDHFVETLRDKGINVIVAEDSPTPFKPDAVFPNNWVTFHQDGTVITYPMLSEKRRLEREEQFIDKLRETFIIKERVHFEHFENLGQILEGTGSIVLDRINRVAYACLSPRTDAQLLDWFCEKVHYEKIVFLAIDAFGQEIYHTNVMMAMGETFVVICLDAVRDIADKNMLLDKFEATNKEIIDISLDQMLSFAGNMLQVRNDAGTTYLIMSEQAFLSLLPLQVEQILSHTQILHSPIYTIEKFGGGSARCMMAEVFLPRRKPIAKN